MHSAAAQLISETRSGYGATDDRTASILRLVEPDSILASLPERDLMALLRQSTVRTLPKNRVLFRCGDEGRSAVLILQGYIKLCATGANDREMVFEIAGPGTIFGELAVLNCQPRQADAVCLTPCRVLAIDGGAFRNAIMRIPEAMLATLRLLSRRLTAVTTRGMETVSLPAPVRLAKALLQLADLQKHGDEGSVRIGFRLSQRELGAMTGLIRESINKHLSAWRAAGWIELSNGTVTLRDVRALRDFVRDHAAE